MKKKIDGMFYLIFILLSLGLPLDAKELDERLPAYFSVEEEFYSKFLERKISEGDLLTWDGALYMTNRELLNIFRVKKDLGLDAVDVIDGEKKLVAFSTEFDHPDGLFSSGDLLFTNGIIIPNRALLYLFPKMSARDMGLDAVQITGKNKSIMSFIYALKSVKEEYFVYNPAEFQYYLNRYNVDIWFSTDGTAEYKKDVGFGDGDLLSAARGEVLLKNSELFTMPVLGGAAEHSGTSGLDALICPRPGVKEYVYFSIEVVDEEQEFSSGDIIKAGVSEIIVPAYIFIEKFEPDKEFVGLDALSFFN